jgi:flavodoxin/ferredoxin
MAKSLIVYFSQSGTTAQVAESIATGLSREGYQVDLCNIKEKQPPDTSGYDLLGIGSPVYFFRPPFIITDYLKSLPDLGGLQAFTFILHGTYRFDTNKSIRQILARKGAQDAGYFHCHGADFWLGYLKEGYLFSPNHPTLEELSMAVDFGSQVAECVDGKSYPSAEEDKPPTFIYRLQRFFLNQWCAERVYSRMVKLDKEKCDACGLCIKLCPRSNIHQDKDGYPVWEQNCLLCLTCEMKCPKDAISTPIGWSLIRPLMRYNVRHALDDPSLDHVRVIHSKGRTQRIQQESSTPSEGEQDGHE